MSFATAVRNLLMPDYDTLAARIAAVEARPAMSDADRALLLALVIRRRYDVGA